MTVQQAMQELDADPTEDTLNAFIAVVSDALARGEPIPDAAMRRYKLATGGAQPLPTVTVTAPANPPVPWLQYGLLALGIGALVMIGRGPLEGDDGDDEG